MRRVNTSVSSHTILNESWKRMGKGLGEEEKEPGNGREGSGRRRGGAWEMKRKGLGEEGEKYR